MKTTDARRDQEGGQGRVCLSSYVVRVSAQLCALEPLRMCSCRWPLFKQHPCLGKQPSNPGYELTASHSYPLIHAPCLHYTHTQTSPTPSHLQNTAPWYTCPSAPESQSFTCVHPCHTPAHCKARYSHMHLSHIHASTQTYPTSSCHTHTHTLHTPWGVALSVTPISHLI